MLKTFTCRRLVGMMANDKGESVRYWWCCWVVAIVMCVSGCGESTDVESVPNYTYEPSQVTGSTIMVGHESYEPIDLPESLSPSE